MPKFAFKCQIFDDRKSGVEMPEKWCLNATNSTQHFIKLTPGKLYNVDDNLNKIGQDPILGKEVPSKNCS